jgi:hypothetical protein
VRVIALRVNASDVIVFLWHRGSAAGWKSRCTSARFLFLFLPACLCMPHISALSCLFAHLQAPPAISLLVNLLFLCCVSSPLSCAHSGSPRSSFCHYQDAFSAPLASRSALRTPLRALLRGRRFVHLKHGAEKAIIASATRHGCFARWRHHQQQQQTKSDSLFASALLSAVHPALFGCVSMFTRRIISFCIGAKWTVDIAHRRAARGAFRCLCLAAPSPTAQHRASMEQTKTLWCFSKKSVALARAARASINKRPRKWRGIARRRNWRQRHLEWRNSRKAAKSLKRNLVTVAAAKSARQ